MQYVAELKDGRKAIIDETLSDGKNAKYVSAKIIEAADGSAIRAGFQVMAKSKIAPKKKL